MSFDLAQLQSLSRQAGWPESLIEKASAIWMYESGGNPNICRQNSVENSCGLAQINIKAHPEYANANLTDPITNLRIGYIIYLKQGWGAWYNSNLKYNR